MIYRFDSIDSTMHEAQRLAHAGVPAGTAVVAGEQTAGQGRHGHSWHSEKGAGLYVSIVLRPNLQPHSLPVLTMALGLATAEAIARVADVACDLRWPNDVMIDDRKVAGILVQLNDAAIAGIGINVNHTSFPADITGLATSLRLATGRSHDHEQLLQTLLETTASFCHMLESGGKHTVLDLFCKRSSYARGKRVRIEGSTEDRIEGVTMGLDENGFLLVKDAHGNTVTVVSGGVRPV